MPRLERRSRHIVAISGGKDSVAMAIRLKEMYPHIKYEYVITPTGDELPEMVEHWKKLETILGELKRISNITIFDAIEREGMIPNFRARFCTRVLKIEPFIDFMESLPSNSVMYVGLRSDEDGRLGLVNKGSKFKVVYPMRDWGWTINDVLAYLKDRKIKIPKRTDCGCCFYQRLPEWRDLLFNHPERYNKYAELEKKMGHTFRSPGRDTWPASLEDLKKEILSGRKMKQTNPRGIKKCRFCSM